jgi:hypothetical protein
MPGHVRARGGRKGNKKSGRKGSTSNSSGGAGKLSLDVCLSNPSSLLEFAKTQPQFSHIQDSFPIFPEILPAKLRVGGKPLTLVTGNTLLDWTPRDPMYPNEGTLTYETNGVKKCVSAYKKTIALLDPYDWMRNKNRPIQPFTWDYSIESILSPENQGYVDTIACALVSKLKTQLPSPHFCEFYGSFRAVADSFFYNLEDDIEDFRFTKWFWDALETGSFQLCMKEKVSGRRLSLQEAKDLLKPDNELLQDTDDDNTDDYDTDANDTDTDDTDTNANATDTTIHTSANQVESNLFLESELEELTDFDLFESSPFDPTMLRGSTPKTARSLETSSQSSYASITEDYTIHSELASMPVIVLFLEKCTNTMDSLLEHKSPFVPIVTQDQHSIWAAWMFQVCAALSQLQSAIQLTHNDLHTNNVLWKPTEEEFIWYKDSSERMWRVPTYGKIFTIIDFGRSIFSLNNYICISSDYDEGHDAYGMYNFGLIEDKTEPRVGPNKSFDLCRLSCSLIRALYPRNPDSNPKGQLLTKEGAWEVRETDQLMFNMLWSWLKTSNGKNVLEFESGKERFPGFELYNIIAAEVKDAVPEQQRKKPIFQPFVYIGSVPENVVWIPI